MKILFNEIAPAQKDRRGGYTRIVRLNQRQGDAGQLAILEWVDMPIVTPTETETETEKKEETKSEEKAAEAAK